MTFAYLTGWRVQSEILPLEWRQVDRHSGTVRLDPGTTKNREGRFFPYGDVLPELREIVKSQWTLTKAVEQDRGMVCPWVFHRSGEQIKSLRTAWRRACAAAGCPHRIPHDFRRTAVRNLVRAGVPDTIAMALTGHKTRAVFDRYDIVDEADLRAGIEKLAGRLAGTKQGQWAGSARVHRLRRRAK